MEPEIPNIRPDGQKYVSFTGLLMPEEQTDMNIGNR